MCIYNIKKKIPRKYFRDKQIEVFQALVKWDFLRSLAKIPTNQRQN